MKHHNKKRNPCESCLLLKGNKTNAWCLFSRIHNDIQDIKVGFGDKKSIFYTCPFNELRKEMKKRLLYGDPDSHPKGMV